MLQHIPLLHDAVVLKSGCEQGLVEKAIGVPDDGKRHSRKDTIGKTQ